MDSDDKIVLQTTTEKKRILAELEHLEKAHKSGIISRDEYVSVRNGLDRKIKNLDKKLKQAEAKQKAVQEIIGAESMLLVSPKKKHQKYFAKIDKGKETELKKDISPPVSKPVQSLKPVVTEPVVSSVPASVQEPPPEDIPQDNLQEDTNWRFALAVLTIFLVILLYIKFSSYGGTEDVLAVDAYLDYASQYNKDMHAVLVQLNSEYGSALLITYHLVGKSEQSQYAAHAVYCADLQDRRQEYLDYLFTHETGADMTAVASSLGLDVSAFDLCMDALYGPETEHVDYTPTLYINNKKIVGAVGYDAVKAVIDAEMTALG